MSRCVDGQVSCDPATLWQTRRGDAMQCKHADVLAFVVLASVLAVSTGPGVAQQPTSEQTAAIRQSCRSDFMSNCSGVQPGGKEAFDCLMRNASRVSAPCKSALDAIGPKPPATETSAPSPAAPPAAARPAAAPPPAAAPTVAPAPPAAAAANKPTTQQMSALRAACRSDFGIHCPGVKPGGKAALRCLEVNAPALSPACRSAVASLGGAASAAPTPAPAASAAPAVAPLGPIPPMRPRKAMQILSFCEPERATLCGGVPAGGGRILECLAANTPRLSPVCYQAIARGIR